MMDLIATLPEFDEAEVFSLTGNYAVLPKRVVMTTDQPLSLMATRPAGMESFTSLTFLGNTQFDVPDTLLDAARRAVQEHMSSIESAEDETGLTPLADIPMSVIEPVSVKGVMIVPDDLAQAAEWTFGVSPMGVWPGHLRIKIEPSEISKVMDWWQNGAQGFAIRYEYVLDEAEHLSVSATSDVLGRTEGLSGPSTMSMWETLKASVKTRSGDPPGKHIQTDIALSKNERDQAMTIMTI